MDQLEYLSLEPDNFLSDMVESIWMVINYDDEKKEGIIVPDGKIDLFLFAGEDGTFEIFISGICTGPVIKPPFPRSTMFAISFHPMAAEYIFKQSFAGLKDNKQVLSPDHWGFCKNDLNNFEQFYKKACNIIKMKVEKKIDERKKKLFELIYLSKGEMTVKELSKKVSWSSRQINRYFNTWLGVSLNGKDGQIDHLISE